MELFVNDYKSENSGFSIKNYFYGTAKNSIPEKQKGYFDYSWKQR